MIPCRVLQPAILEFLYAINRVLSMLAING
jgi:hypothetical protein